MKPPDEVEILYRRHYRDVVGYLVRLGFPFEDAREMAQDVFIRVYSSMGNFREGSAWSFLKKTARNFAANTIRDQKTLKRFALKVSLESESLPPLSESVAQDLWSGQVPPTPEDDLIEREERERRSRRLRTAIEELPDIIRRCLLLLLGGLKYREIQKVEGITMDAVRSRLNDARNRLRKRLKEEPEGLDWPAVTPDSHLGGQP